MHAETHVSCCCCCCCCCCCRRHLCCAGNASGGGQGGVDWIHQLAGLAKRVPDQAGDAEAPHVRGGGLDAHAFVRQRYQPLVTSIACNSCARARGEAHVLKKTLAPFAARPPAAPRRASSAKGRERPSKRCWLVYCYHLVVVTPWRRRLCLTNGGSEPLRGSSAQRLQRPDALLLIV